MTELDQLKAEERRLENEEEDLRKQIDPLQTKLFECVERLRGVRERRGELEMKTTPVLDLVAALKVLDTPQGSMPLYRRLARELYEQFGMSTSGRWTDTQEYALAFSVNDNDESEAKALAGTKFWIPNLTPLADGMVWFVACLSGSLTRRNSHD